MTQALTPAAAPAARPRLSTRVSFFLLASIIVSFLAGSSAPTPLYALYQAAWGFTPITTTVIFGVYALAVLASLLTVGSLSDFVGRRPVLLVAVAMQMLTMVLFVSAGSVTTLVVARILQGLSAGAAVSALGAGMLDLDRARGTTANAVAPMTGTASGALVSGLCVQFLPLPTTLVYLLLLGVFAVQGVGVLLMTETAVPRPGALASLRPKVGLPLAVRRPALVAMPLLVAAWAFAGFYGSLGPVVVRTLVGSTSVLLGGFALFVLAASGAITVLVFQQRDARSLTLLGAGSLAVGVGITLVGIEVRSALLFFVGAVVAGAGFGGGFQGALRSVIPLAPADHRAGVLSVLLVVSYLAMGLPAVIAGARVVSGVSVFRTAQEYGLAVMVLSLVAFVGTRLRRPAVSRPTG